MKNILFIGNPNSIHDIKWISYFSNKPNQYKTYLIYEKQIKIDIYQLKKELNEKNIILLDPISSFSLIRSFSTIHSLISINKIIKKFNVDIIHILFATPHAFWGLFLKNPFIITTRGSDILKVIPSLKSEKGIKKIYFEILFYILKFNFKKANVITSTSEFQIENINKLFSVKSQLIKTGIDFDQIQKEQDKDLLHSSIKGKKYIFSPRFFSPIYNINLQIEAIKYFKKEIINEYVFVFIKGENYDSDYALKIEKKLNSLSDSLKINYVILNFLSQEEMWCYFQNTSLTIMTPISDGTPNSALEAMASKSPLIISDLPHLDNKLFSNTCIKFKGNDPEILAKIIEKTILNYPIDFLDKALINVEKYGNRITEMKKMESLYESI
jgi:hypothetical protein